MGENRPPALPSPLDPVEMFLSGRTYRRMAAQYRAIRRVLRVEAIVGNALERNLPRFKVEREG